MKHFCNCLLIIILSLMNTAVFAQTCFDDIADVLIPESPFQLEKESEERTEFMSKVNCFLGEDLDTVDLEIVTENSYLEVIIMLDQTTNDDAITYGKLKELFIDFVSDESYTKIRELHLLTRDFSLKPAIYDNWEKDKHILLNLGIPENRLEPFKTYLEKHPNTGKTYQELMQDFETSKATNQKEE